MLRDAVSEVNYQVAIHVIGGSDACKGVDRNEVANEIGARICIASKRLWVPPPHDGRDLGVPNHIECVHETRVLLGRPIKTRCTFSQYDGVRMLVSKFLNQTLML